MMERTKSLQNVWRQRARKFDLSKNVFDKSCYPDFLMNSADFDKKAVKGGLQFECPILKYQILNRLQHMCNPHCSKLSYQQ